MFFNVVTFLWFDTVSLSNRFPGLSQYKLWFQDPVSPMMEGIIHLHHDVMFLIWVILGLVFWALFQVINRFDGFHNQLASNKTHGVVLETVWTISPSLVLITIAIPTFALLYALDEGVEPALTLKVLGHQWYWSYEYSDFFVNNSQNLDEAFFYELDCYMVSESDMHNYDQLRLLETDQVICLPIDTHIRLVVTAVDVLHSWAVPSLGVKLDACPGRLNQVALYLNQRGTFFGQCSEICGTNHAFMPIMLVGTSAEGFKSWLVALYSSLNSLVVIFSVYCLNILY